MNDDAVSYDLIARIDALIYARSREWTKWWGGIDRERLFDAVISEVEGWQRKWGLEHKPR